MQHSYSACGISACGYSSACGVSVLLLSMLRNVLTPAAARFLYACASNFTALSALACTCQCLHCSETGRLPGLRSESRDRSFAFPRVSYADVLRFIPVRPYCLLLVFLVHRSRCLLLVLLVHTCFSSVCLLLVSRLLRCCLLLFALCCYAVAV